MKPVVALDIDGTLGDCLVETTTRQSRKAWEKAHGPIPEGLQVLHKCDNKLCRRLDHLYLGTPKQNTADMLARDRHGEHMRPKISDEIIARWKSGEKSRDLAEEVGCHPMSISWAARHRSR